MRAAAKADDHSLLSFESLFSTSANGRKISFMPTRYLFSLTAATLVASLFFGGGTRTGLLSDAILQFLAMPLLFIALWRWSDLPSGQRLRGPPAFCVAVALLFSFQLLPLSPTLWTALPHRELVVDSFHLVDAPLPWLPISVAPFATMSSSLSLIPPVAIFLAVSVLDPDERRRLTLFVLPIGALSAFVGLLQISQGPESPLRFFAHTNLDEAVGFFANRNHFAALLYCSIILTAVWIQQCALATDAHHKDGFTLPTFIAIPVGVAMIVILMSGEAMARSRAGLALTVLALVGAFALSYSRRSTSDAKKASSLKPLFGAVAFGIALSMQFALFRVLGRIDTDILEDARWSIARRTIEAAIAYLPFGAGIGTFVPVYAARERLEDAMVNLYVNRAHNDFIELWLETGLIGLGLVLFFVSWWGRRTFALWRHTGLSFNTSDLLYARAGSLIVALLLLHSLIDYPLRTAAIATIFALACGLMVEPSTAHSKTMDLKRFRKAGSKRNGLRGDAHALS